MLSRSAAGAFVIALACGSCGGAAPKAAAPPVPLRVVSKSELTPREIQYGRAPRRDQSVTYGPDVILVEGGADVIRAAGSDGLTWTIDARAGHAGELVEGKIAFITDRCAGRVLAAKREGDNLSLVLGPVEITDLFEALDVSVEGQPINLDQAIERKIPALPDVAFPLEGDAAAPPEWSVNPPRIAALGWMAPSDTPPVVRAAALQMTAAQRQYPGAPGILPIVPPLQWHTEPLSKGEGFGAQLAHDGTNGLRVIAQVQMRLRQPTLDLHLAIANRQLREARLVLKNAVGLLARFDAAGNDAFSGAVNWYAPAPGMTIPLAGPVPFNVDVRQDIWVRTVFSSRQTMFSAGGEYDLNGDVGLVYQNGTFKPVGPGGLVVRKSFLSNMSGVSIGPAGLVISDEITITGGIGTLQFTVGPSVAIATSVGVAQGSSAGIVNCRGAAIAMDVRGGVGWTIPRPIATIVNGFLKLLNVKPIADHGGHYTPYKRLFQQQAQTESPVCGDGGGAM